MTKLTLSTSSSFSMIKKPKPRDSPLRGFLTMRASRTGPYFSNFFSKSCSEHSHQDQHHACKARQSYTCCWLQGIIWYRNIATPACLTLSLMMKLSPAANRCRPVVGAGRRERTGDLYLGGPISLPYRGGGDLLRNTIKAPNARRTASMLLKREQPGVSAGLTCVCICLCHQIDLGLCQQSGLWSGSVTAF